MKIGLVGEAPTDTSCVEAILKKKFPLYTYKTLISQIHGSLLDNARTKRLLRIEYESEKPDLVIFVRDLDSLKDNKTQLNIRKKYFTENNRVVDKKGIFLLNIFEIEALLLTDLEKFFNYYKKKNDNYIVFSDVMEVPETKEYLKSIEKEYIETHNSKIFELFEFEKLLDCKYFRSFIEKLKKELPN